ncbi:hypothetical protein L596_003537 [Steinernema carpocapsae]|uniref:Caprin-1 dimerization domain-containing protein n=2 Tax=Steinernema carpocapsae TaxID=34508 RepID=A0A4U8USR6_STECR|nr:hypothetical protein L596_003537 [Steinernema carpocapsae]
MAPLMMEVANGRDDSPLQPQSEESTQSLSEQSVDLIANPFALLESFLDRKKKSLQKRYTKLASYRDMDKSKLEAEQREALLKIDDVTDRIEMINNVREAVSKSLQEYEKSVKQAGAGSKKKEYESQKEFIGRYFLFTNAMSRLSEKDLGDRLVNDSVVTDKEFETLSLISKAFSMTGGVNEEEQVSRIHAVLCGTKDEIHSGMTGYYAKKLMTNVISSETFKKPVSSKEPIVTEPGALEIDTDLAVGASETLAENGENDDTEHESEKTHSKNKGDVVATDNNGDLDLSIVESAQPASPGAGVVTKPLKKRSSRGKRGSKAAQKSLETCEKNANDENDVGKNVTGTAVHSEGQDSSDKIKKNRRKKVERRKSRPTAANGDSEKTDKTSEKSNSELPIAKGNSKETAVIKKEEVPHRKREKAEKKPVIEKAEKKYEGVKKETFVKLKGAGEAQPRPLHNDSDIVDGRVQGRGRGNEQRGVSRSHNPEDHRENGHKNNTSKIPRGIFSQNGHPAERQATRAVKDPQINQAEGTR